MSAKRKAEIIAVCMHRYEADRYAAEARTCHRWPSVRVYGRTVKAGRATWTAWVVVVEIAEVLP